MILIHQRHRQTDRRTDGRHAISIPRYALVHRAVKIGIYTDTYTAAAAATDDDDEDEDDDERDSADDNGECQRSVTSTKSYTQI